MSKAKILPPRKPKGESAKITIANLELQVRNLTDRVEHLVKSRDDATKLRLEFERAADEARKERDGSFWSQQSAISQLNECQAKLASTEQRFEGYRQAIEDVCRS